MCEGLFCSASYPIHFSYSGNNIFCTFRSQKPSNHFWPWQTPGRESCSPGKWTVNTRSRTQKLSSCFNYRHDWLPGQHTIWKIKQRNYCWLLPQSQRSQGHGKGGEWGERKRRGRVSQRTRARSSKKDIIRPCSVVWKQFHVPMKTVSIPAKQYRTAQPWTSQISLMVSEI